MPHMPAPTGWINIGTPSYVSDAPPQKVDPAMYR